VAGSESLNQAVLEWSAQTVLRATSSGSIERLVDADFLGIEAQASATKRFLDTLTPEHQESVVRLALETAAVPGARARCSVPAFATNGSIRHLDIRFVNAMNDPRVGSLLIYVQDGTDTATAEKQIYVQSLIADFAAAFAGSMSSQLQETIDEQLVELINLFEAAAGTIGLFDKDGTLQEHVFRNGVNSPTTKRAIFSIADLLPDPYGWARRGEHLTISKRIISESGNPEVGELLLIPRRWPDNQIGFLGLCGPEGFARRELVPIAISFADLVGGSMARIRAVRSIVESEQRHRLILDRSPDHLMLIDKEHCFTYVSPSVERFLGLTSDELLGTHVKQYVHPDDYAQLQCFRDGHVQYSLRARSADGTWRWVEGTLQVLLGDPSINGLLVNGRDVTDIRKAREALVRQQSATELIATISRRFARGRTRDSEQLLIATAGELLTHVGAQEAIVWRINDNGTELVANAYFQSLIEAERTLPIRLLQEYLPELIAGDVTFALAASKHNTEFLEVVHTEGRTELRTVIAIPVLAQQRLVGLVTMTSDVDVDVDESTKVALRAVCEVLASSFSKLEFEQTLRRRATTDDLTGLVNRAALHELLESSLIESASSGEIVSVALLDLDEFKIINDTMGHETGDELLRALAIRLRQSLRTEDVLARLGGDEFVVLMTTAGPVSESELRERIDSVFATPFSLQGRSIRLSASVGVAQSALAGVTSAQELMRRADIAMYRAKLRGPGEIQLFEDDMDTGVQATMQLVEDLRAGIEGDQFEVWLQPVMERRSKEPSLILAMFSGQPSVNVGPPVVTIFDTSLAGFEALVRWNHPTRGLVMPVDFIPVAEQFGLINELGSIVLRKAMSSLRSLLDAEEVPPETFVAINVSTAQLVAPDFGESVLSMMLQSGLSPSQIHLELTESILAQQMHWERLSWLRALGFQLAIDDFGTGFSSLSYARDMPADSLKVDKSFVAGVAIDRRDHALAAAVVSMGHALGMTVVAEGVESEDQFVALAGLGCTRFQGYFFSRPMPLAGFREWNNAHLVGSLLSSL
jgi:diguanylate cyclase